MKRIVTLLLAVLLLLSLAACAAAKESTPAVEETPAASEETPAAAGETPGTGEQENAAPVDQPDLSEATNALGDEQVALLEKILLIDELVQPGTAGGSLRAVAASASLLDWAETAQLSEESISMIMDYIASKTPEGQEEFNAKLDAVDATVQYLTGSDSETVEGMLSDAGMLDSCNYPWSKAAPETVERLMQALGRRSV